MMARWYRSEPWQGGPCVWVPEEVFPPDMFAQVLADEPQNIVDLEGDPDIGPAMPMWTVYARPKDFPTKIVARKSLSSVAGVVQCRECITADTMVEIREKLRAECAVSARLNRQPDDDPNIVEVWL